MKGKIAGFRRKIKGGGYCKSKISYYDYIRKNQKFQNPPISRFPYFPISRKVFRESAESASFACIAKEIARRARDLDLRNMCAYRKDDVVSLQCYHKVPVL